MENAYDLGLGAGFYVNATQEPWSRHYHMYDYIVDELPALIEQSFPSVTVVPLADIRWGDMGPSLLHCVTRAVIARSLPFPLFPIRPMPHGAKKRSAITLAATSKAGSDYDATFLIKAADRAEHLPMLIDQGDADEFLAEQLKPERLIDACRSANYPVQFNMRAGYDHSYFFISTFIESHLRFHAGALGG